MNHEFLDVRAGFRKGRGTRDQIANIHWIIKKARKFQKNIYFCFIDYAKAFDCVDHHKLWKILKEMGIADHLTCLLRNLYAGQEATVITGHGTTDWFQMGKGVHQGCALSPCLFPSICLSNLGRVLFFFFAFPYLNFTENKRRHNAVSVVAQITAKGLYTSKWKAPTEPHSLFTDLYAIHLSNCLPGLQIQLITRGK